MNRPTAVDLFSGAGGASLGIVNAGYDLRLAIDVDSACGLTHSANLPGDFLVGDLREIDAEKIMSTAGVRTGDPHLLNRFYPEASGRRRPEGAAGAAGRPARNTLRSRSGSLTVRMRASTSLVAAESMI